MFALTVVLRHLLVVCDGAHCAGRIEFAHAPAACCAHEHGHGDHDAAEHANEPTAAPHGGDLPCLEADHGGCSDVLLELENGPLPQRPALPDHAGNQLAFAIDDVRGAAPPPAPRCLRPPPTGPPRPHALLRQRRTDVLLV